MAGPFETLDAKTPIVLLPVRLEIRWFTRTAAEHELRVRVYPDAVHVTRRRDGIDAVEQTETREYWRIRSSDGPDAAATQAAWKRLVATFGLPRAAYLEKTLEPARAPDGTLTFPQVAVAPEDGPDTTEAEALPDRFVVLGYEGGERVFAAWGKPVPSPLPAGPADPEDAGRRWQTAFDAAEAVGMGIRVAVTVERASRLTRLAVLGVRESGAPDASAALLAELIERHATDDGAALLPAGTPTNHTASARVGQPARPSGEPAPQGSDGARLAVALGLDPAQWRWVANAEKNGDSAARAMNAALWPATWEYFLEEIARPLCSDQARAAGRSLFINHVRGRGPFPTLALGRQPYGILPVSPMRLWKSDQGQPDAFADLLLRLRPRWQSAAASAPRLPADGDPLETLVEILSTQPSSIRWLGRSAATAEIALPRWMDDLGLGTLAQAQLNALALSLLAELVPLGFPVEAARAVEPLIFGDEPYDVDLPLARRRGLTVFHPGVNPATYLNSIAAASPDALRTHAVAGSSPRTLLYLLARHATLRVMARAAGGMVATPLIFARREDAVVLDSSSTVWTRFHQPVALFGNRPAGEIVSRTDLPAGVLFTELKAHRASLRLLAGVAPEEIERLAAEAIDLASHRLDAWTTALATERLLANRAAGVRGAYLGAYAWLETPGPPAQPATDGAAPQDAAGHGFVHAPSLEQARTAAVLRAGFVARPTGDLAINLSSERVRRARWVLSELAAGESLAALIGYRIERLLGERNLGARIAPLRRQFPLAQSAAGDVVRPRLDGLAAHHAWSAAPPEEPLRPVAAAIAELVDALADLLLAETVHQQVNGSPERVAHLLEALEAGTAVPSDPAVVKSPVPADQITWRIALSLPETGAGWPEAGLSARALANPVLEKWVAGLLPPPASLTARLRARLSDGSDSQTTVAVSTLRLCALDFVALAGDRFASSALAALLAAEVPAGSSVVAVEPGDSLSQAHLTARAVGRALKTAAPWKAEGAAGESGPPEEWRQRQAAGTAAIERDRDHLADAASRRRAAALLGAPAADTDPVRRRLNDLAARARQASPEEAIRLMSGLPAEGEAPVPPLAPGGGELATASGQAAWLSDLARVRPAIEGLDLIDIAQRRRTGRGLTLAVASSSADRRLVIAGASPTAAGIRGLVLDAWVEATPRAETTSALAFHHDSPNARAPQAILIAVPPDPSRTWSLDALEATLQETIELSLLRLARPQAVWGTLLPAIYLAENLDDDTISTPLGDSAVVTVVRD